MFALSQQPLCPQHLLQQLAPGTAAGAVVCFEGRVRAHFEGRPVLRLDYEAHEALALVEGQRVLAEAIDRFGVSAACVHRLGALALGEIAVWVGVAGGHRGESFEACRYIIDEVKRRVPIWKREHYADGPAQWRHP